MASFFLTLSIICNIVANGFFKTASLRDDGQAKWLIYGVGLLIGLLNTLAYLKALETMKLSIAYAVFGAMSTIGIAVVGLLYFHEEVSVLKIVGLGVIAVGMMLLWKS